MAVHFKLNCIDCTIMDVDNGGFARYDTFMLFLKIYFSLLMVLMSICRFWFGLQHMIILQIILLFNLEEVLMFMVSCFKYLNLMFIATGKG